MSPESRDFAVASTNFAVSACLKLQHDGALSLNGRSVRQSDLNRARLDRSRGGVHRRYDDIAAGKCVRLRDPSASDNGLASPCGCRLRFLGSPSLERSRPQSNLLAASNPKTFHLQTARNLRSSCRRQTIAPKKGSYRDFRGKILSGVQANSSRFACRFRCPISANPTDATGGSSPFRSDCSWSHFAFRQPGSAASWHTVTLRSRNKTEYERAFSGGMELRRSFRL